MTVESASTWPMPPQDGHTLDDLLTLPNLPPHTELIDGSLVFASAQREFHSVVIDRLMAGLRRSMPPELKAVRQMTVVLDKRNGPEPDVSVVRAEAVINRSQTCFTAADVQLAVEVVSPDSEARDRHRKPHLYAEVGIPHFWLVEMGGTDEHPVVHVFERSEVTKTYALTGIHHDRLKLSVPFDIDIDLSDVDNL
ncbi:Uma2 family endonuclease [Streptomyces peucetius]|uniref:Uma2 family endonuclease n=1 Tax=Streptomyces peucetius TaxID=1950 RepID=A0ABY6IA85_STRPE|nr:Uma2 family endonuclease [Streptomyces peucetius]UYQ63912.1 Uma2 family endonuclease [Streptomyces peucetius]